MTHDNGLLSRDTPCSIASLAYRQVERVDDEPCCWHCCWLQSHCPPGLCCMICHPQTACPLAIWHRERWRTPCRHHLRRSTENIPRTSSSAHPAPQPLRRPTSVRFFLPMAFLPWRGLAYASGRWAQKGSGGANPAALSKLRGSLAGRYVLGDGLTQRLLERREHDWRRSCLFGSFGAVMGAPAYLFYVPWILGCLDCPVHPRVS